MIINVTDKYRINFSDGRNYQPEFFKEGGEHIQVAGRDIVTKDEWKSYGKYFGTLEACLVFLARQSVTDEFLELTLSQYIDRLESALDRLREACVSGGLN